MNSCGATALHDAVLRGDKDIVEELLQSGANPLIQAMKGCALCVFVAQVDVMPQFVRCLTVVWKARVSFLKGQEFLCTMGMSTCAVVLCVFW
jgi:ankyrin repeat protein